MIRSVIFSALAVAALASCASLPANLRTPEVSFVGLKSLQASVFEQKLEVRLKVRNPNSIDLPVDGLDVDIELAGEPFAHGVSARQFVIPADGEAEFDMNVTANAMNALLKIAGERNAEAIGYKLHGKLSTRLGLLRTIPFTETGTVPVSELLGGKHKGG